MPRQARQKGEFSVYHVIQRGNERKNIFLSEEDKLKFLEIIERMKSKYNFLLYAFCLIDNHVHLLIDANGNDISQILKSINISYAYYFNRIHRRCGHLFQDRFKSELVNDERYFLEVSRYIHNNPVKAGMVDNPFDYKWSSSSSYTGRTKNISDLIETKKILSCFSEDLNIAKKEYTKFVTDKVDVEVRVMDIEDDDVFESNSDRIFTMEEAKKKLKELAGEKGTVFENLIMDTKTRDEAIRLIRKNSSLTLKQLGILFGGISESRISRIVGKLLP